MWKEKKRAEEKTADAGGDYLSHRPGLRPLPTAFQERTTGAAVRHFRLLMP